MSSRSLPSLRRWARKPTQLLWCAALLAAAVGCAQAPTGAGAPIARAAPESVGMSSARLERITATFDQEVAAKRLPGAVAMVSRKGKVVYAHAFGLRDPKASDAMQLDSVFRIYSMTKPFAAVGAMILVEDGVLQLGDPVSKWLPAFKDVKVSTPAGDVAPTRAMTVQDLLRHTAGLPYGELTQNAAVKDALTKAGLYKPGVIDFDVRDLTAAEQVERLAKIPLLHQPGTTWEYSLSTDVLGRVIEAASGQRLGDFLQARLFVPLKMNDTAFYLLPGQRARLAEPFDKDPVSGTPIRLIDVSQKPANDSAGAGCVSTAADYLRFELMMLNGGELDGVRVLSRSTIKWMTSDHLGPRITLAANPGGGVLASSGYTFGLGFAVRPADGLVALPGSAGDYNWGGYAGTGFWIDPKEQLVAVFMVQQLGPLRLHHRNLIRQLVYQAIVD
jgi:CubicO group peptidase (beta-lactamase class C family)